MTRTRLYGLDGLRGVAALVVVFGHAGLPIRSYGLAVDFFFLLSGFVMARTYQGRIDRGDWRGFMRERVIRLWPLLILGVLLGAIPVALSNSKVSLGVEVPLALLALPNISSSLLFGVDAPRWSLFFEVVANVGHCLARRAAVGAVAAMVAICAAVLAWNCWTTPGEWQATHAAAFGVDLARVGFSYGLGVILCWTNARLPRLPFLLAAVLLVAGLLAPLEGGLKFVTLTLLWPLILLGSVTESAPSPLARMVLGAMGGVSYPLYILHRPILELFTGAQHRLGWPATTTTIVFVVVAVAFSWAAMRLYDIPARRWLGRLAVRPQLAAS